MREAHVFGAAAREQAAAAWIRRIGLPQAAVAAVLDQHHHAATVGRQARFAQHLLGEEGAALEQRCARSRALGGGERVQAGGVIGFDRCSRGGGADARCA